MSDNEDVDVTSPRLKYLYRKHLFLLIWDRELFPAMIASGVVACIFAIISFIADDYALLMFGVIVLPLLVLWDVISALFRYKDKANDYAQKEYQRVFDILKGEH